MNEIARELKQKSITTAFPLELPSIEDIIEAQEAMLIHIPIDLRDYLLHCSDAIYGHFEPVTLADPHAHTYLPDVAAEAWGQGMPREYLPLCKTDDGIYCVGDDDTVYLWCNDENVEEVCDSVWGWVRDIWLAA